MIYVTQGDIESIGLEVFFKSLNLLTEQCLEEITLVGHKEYIEDCLQRYRIPYKANNGRIKLNNKLFISFIPVKSELDESPFTSFLKAIEVTKNTDILFTLPMKKSSFKSDEVTFSGHTDYFRKKYPNKDCQMVFFSEQEAICLMTDHISIEKVSDTLTESFIYQKIKFLKNNIKNYLPRINRILVSGINPHCGENGAISHQDYIINKIVQSDEICSGPLKVEGPYPADTIHQYIKNSKETLVVFSYHDQGLTYFKSRNNFIGINLTIGLPFTRLSVDHGTAPEIAGKNIANPLGCFYALLNAIKIHRNLNNAIYKN